MKKILKIFVLVLVILSALTFCLLFTQAGNNILKPVIEERAQKTANIDVKLDKFSLRLNSLSIEATIMQNIKIKAAGSINLFKRSFDIDYNINADELPEIEGIKIDEPLKVAGEIVGDFKFFNAHGMGEIFKSALDFNVTLKDFNVAAITANVKELQISKLLAVLNQPFYADGVISADIHMMPNEKNELFGDSFVSVDNGVLFKDVLQKEFNLTLDKNPTYRFSSNFSVQDSNEIKGNAEIVSSLAILKIPSISYNINDAEAIGDYTLDVRDLGEFSSIVGMPLKGAIKVYGDMKYASSQLQLSAKSDNIASGKLNAKLDNDKFVAEFLHVKIEEILKMFVLPNYASGDLNIKIDLSSLANKNGEVNIDVNSGAIDAKVVQKEFNLTLKENVSYKAAFGFKLANNGDLSGDINLMSSLINFKAPNSKININTLDASSDYRLDIPNLKQLETLAGIPIQGALSFYGDVKYGKDTLKANVNSDNFIGGKLEAKLDNDKFDVNILNVRLAEILSMFSKPNYADANLNVKANFSSLKNQTGSIGIDVTDGLADIATLKKEFNVTLPKTEFSAKTNVTVQNKIADFDMKFLSTLVSLDRFVGSFDIDKNILKSNYMFNISDLSKFESIAHQQLVGALSADGIVNYEKDNLHANGKSNILGGKINFDFNDMKVVLKGEGLSSIETLKMLSYPPVFDAKIALNATYDIAKSNGTFNATSLSGKFVKTQLGDLIKTFTDFDITSEVYNNMLLQGKIDKADINFLFDMKSTKSSIFIKNGNILGNILNIPFTLYIEKTDLEGKITGTTDKPKVSVDSSQYLKNKAIEEANRYIEKNSDKIDEAVNKALKKLFK
ncbi:MAG: hypothetical protein LBH45_00750 [Campylobacteraceae bacterium]|jgi:hypothetical protein|nr:hypothetical protein [Campylobacteraceae bacterium]